MRGCRQPFAAAMSPVAAHRHEHVPKELVQVVGTRSINRSSPSEAGTSPDVVRCSDMSLSEIAKPLARAINIYRAVTRHDLDIQTQRDLARHIKKLAEQETQDPSRLTVHGLSFLRARERTSKQRAR
jgi:hypothetical protein